MIKMRSISNLTLLFCVGFLNLQIEEIREISVSATRSSPSCASRASCGANTVCIATNVSTYCRCAYGAAGYPSTNGSGCAYLDPDLVDVAQFS